MTPSPKKAPAKVKPVKGWVVVYPDSPSIETAFIRDTEEEALEDCASNSFMTVAEYRKRHGVVAIPVLITPIE